MPAEKHKAGTIFVCSMGDQFNRDIPTRWIIEVFDACLAAPQHHYLFLTKFPERYQELEHLALLPHGYNFWYGTTVTRNHELGRISHLPLSAHRFVSIEPILENIGLDLGPVLNPAGPAAVVPPVEWVIVGAETGNQKSKKVPRREWLTNYSRRGPREPYSRSDEEQQGNAIRLGKCYPPGISHRPGAHAAG